MFFVHELNKAHQHDTNKITIAILFAYVHRHCISMLFKIYLLFIKVTKKVSIQKNSYSILKNYITIKIIPQEF